MCHRKCSGYATPRDTPSSILRSLGDKAQRLERIDGSTLDLTTAIDKQRRIAGSDPAALKARVVLRATCAAFIPAEVK